MRESGGLRAQWITEPDALAELAAAWDELALRQAAPFVQHAWLTAWLAAFGVGVRLKVATVWDGDELRAGLALGERRPGRLESLSNTHTPEFVPLAVDAPAAATLGRAVQDARAEVRLDAVAVEDPVVAALAGAWERDLTLLEPVSEAPVVRLEGDYEGFRQRTRHQWGAPLERFRRKMHRDHEAEFVLVEAPHRALDVVEEGLRLEAAGWKGQAGTAILSRPDTAAFYRSVSKALAAAGQLRVSALRLDGRLVAFDLCVLHAGRLHLLKTAYDEDMRRLAPGLVLRLAVVERCYELGLVAHELGGGPDPWKLKFADATRRQGTLWRFRRSPAAALRFGYRRAVRPALRRTYRRIRPRG